MYCELSNLIFLRYIMIYVYIINHMENIFQVCLLQQSIKREMIIRIKITTSSLQGYVQCSAPVNNTAKENQHMAIWPDEMTEQIGLQVYKISPSVMQQCLLFLWLLKNDHCFGVPNLYKEHQIYIADLTTIILYFYRLFQFTMHFIQKKAFRFFYAKFLYCQFSMPAFFKGIKSLVIFPIVQSQLTERCSSHLQCINLALFMQHGADHVERLLDMS